MQTLSIREIIEGSYKEGFNLEYTVHANVVEITKSSLREWASFFTGIDARISRDLKQFYPEYRLEWV